MKKPNLTPGKWEARAIAALPALLEALERLLPDHHREDDDLHDGKIAGEITWHDVRAIKAALTLAGYEF